MSLEALNTLLKAGMIMGVFDTIEAAHTDFLEDRIDADELERRLDAILRVRQAAG